MLICGNFLPGFSQWFRQMGGNQNDLYDVLFIHQDTGWIAGFDGTLLATTDGGLIWRDINPGIPGSFNKIAFQEPAHVWVAGDSALLMTSDLFTNYSIQTASSHGAMNFNAVYFLDSLHGWLGGRDTNYTAYIAYTVDGGQNWIRGNFPVAPFGWDVNFTSIVFANLDTGYACSRGFVARSIDGGRNWEITDTASVLAGLMFNILEDLHVFSRDSVITCGWYGPYLGYTINAGEQWQHNTSWHLNSLDFINDSTGFAAGWCNLLRTDDYGQTWRDISGGNTDFCQVKVIDFIDENIAYAVGSNGLILKTLNAGLSAVGEAPGSQSPLTIFPNPASDYLNIQFGTRTEASLKVYNALGALVYFEPVSKRELQMEVSAWPRGIYFLSLEEGQFNYSKRFILCH